MLESNLKKILVNYYGINLHLMLKLLNHLGFALKVFSKSNLGNLILKYEEYVNFLFLLENIFLVKARLKDKLFINIRRLRKLRNYRGYRHIYNLPVRGQRTRSNGKTSKKRSKEKLFEQKKKEIKTKNVKKLNINKTTTIKKKNKK